MGFEIESSMFIGPLYSESLHLFSKTCHSDLSKTERNGICLGSYQLHSQTLYSSKCVNNKQNVKRLICYITRSRSVQGFKCLVDAVHHVFSQLAVVMLWNTIEAEIKSPFS